jgi:ubiquinone/menaquinone biosynthesis C-methylase UbiE
MQTEFVDTSYEPFSRQPEYIEPNRAFVRGLPLESASRVLDLACGTGTISELMLEAQPNLMLFGLDLSRESLQLGRSDFLAAGMGVEDKFVLSRRAGNARARVVLVEGSADCLPFRDGWADLVFMGHSIHLLRDRDLLLAEIRRVLRPNRGIFAFNSAFYAGSQAPGTDHFYMVWWNEAIEYIKRRDAARKAEGLPGIKRARGTVARAETWLSRDQWCALLRAQGFSIEYVGERTTWMGKESLETVGSYSGFARVVLSGYPVELACEALGASVEVALQKEGITKIPRLWLEVAARSTSGA